MNYYGPRLQEPDLTRPLSPDSSRFLPHGTESPLVVVFGRTKDSLVTRVFSWHRVSDEDGSLNPSGPGPTEEVPPESLHSRNQIPFS